MIGNLIKAITINTTKYLTLYIAKFVNKTFNCIATTSTLWFKNVTFFKNEIHVFPAFHFH